MINNKKIKWVFFDVGGVLTDDKKTEIWRIKNLTSIAKKYNPAVTKDKVEKTHQQASKILGSINRNIFKILTKDKKKTKKAIEELYCRYKKKNYTNNSPVRSDALLVIKKLAKNYSLGLVANQPEATKIKLKKSNLDKYFSHFGVSKEYKLSKPNKKLFLTILKETKAKPELSVFIDDNPERGLIPAKKLGFTTIWYRHNYWGKRPFSKSSIDYEISNLNELLKLLK